MKFFTFFVFFSLAVSCSSDSENNTSNNQNEDVGVGSDQAQQSATYKTCGDDHVGTFAAALSDGFSTVQGQVADGVNPSNVWTIEQSVGACELKIPKNLFCDPPCGGGTTCSDNGSCVPTPSNAEAGEISIVGLSAGVTMSAIPPTNFYNFVGELPHPAFTSQTEATLTASGGTISAFEITTVGVDAIETSLTEVPIDMGTGASVTWSAGPDDDRVRVELELNIANHGGTPGRIECTVPDSGDFTIPAELVDALLSKGFSGFPSLVLTRQGASSYSLATGCVDFRLQSELLIPVEIPGLVSCSLPEDCPDGQTCLPDLTCG